MAISLVTGLAPAEPQFPTSPDGKPARETRTGGFRRVGGLPGHLSTGAPLLPISTPFSWKATNIAAPNAVKGGWGKSQQVSLRQDSGNLTLCSPWKRGRGNGPIDTPLVNTYIQSHYLLLYTFLQNLKSLSKRISVFI